MSKFLIEEAPDVQVLIEGAEGSPKKYFIEGVFMQAEIPNKNRRKYPLNVLEREVNRYNREMITERRSVGELAHPCFTKSAQVLTISGWKSIVDIEVGTEIFTLNKDTMEIEVQPVLDSIHVPFTGNMIRIKNRTIDTTVTPNHKFPIIDRYKGVELITAADIEESIEVSNKHSHSYIPKHGAVYTAVSPATYVIGSKVFDFTTFVSFLSLYLAEGHCKKRKKRENSYVISIFQNAGANAEKIDLLLTSMSGLKWKQTIKTPPNRSAHIEWTCHDRELAEYLYELGLCYDKYVPQDVLDSIDEASAFEMLRWYVLGDGRGSLKELYSKCDIFSTSEKIIDSFSVIAAKAGIVTGTSILYPDKDYLFAGRVIKAENKSPLYFLKFLNTKGVYVDKRHMSTEKVPYDDLVHCLTVANGIFMAKDNGYAFWSGNSGPNINYDRVSHLVTELKQVGNDFIGKAKILTDMPCGKIVKSLMDENIKFGVSSRGVGTLKRGNGCDLVEDNYHLAVAADIVADPSAPSAFVSGLMESREWIFEAGVWREQQIIEARNEIDNANRADREAKILKIFEDFMLGK